MSNSKSYNFPRKERARKSQVIKEEKFSNERQTSDRIGLFKYFFKCDWLIELSDNSLTGELVKNRSF